jgi:hypothetical protein
MRSFTIFTLHRILVTGFMYVSLLRVSANLLPPRDRTSGGLSPWAKPPPGLAVPPSGILSSAVIFRLNRTAIYQWPYELFVLSISDCTDNKFYLAVCRINQPIMLPTTSGNMNYQCCHISVAIRTIRYQTHRKWRKQHL